MKDISTITSSPKKSPSQNKHKKNVSIISNEINDDNPEVQSPLNSLTDGNINIQLKKASYNHKQSSVIKDNIKKFKKNAIKETKNNVDLEELKPEIKINKEKKEEEGTKTTIYERFKEKHAKKLLNASQELISREQLKAVAHIDLRKYDKLVADFSYENTKRALQVYHHVFSTNRDYQGGSQFKQSSQGYSFLDKSLDSTLTQSINHQDLLYDEHQAVTSKSSAAYNSKTQNNLRLDLLLQQARQSQLKSDLYSPAPQHFSQRPFMLTDSPDLNSARYPVPMSSTRQSMANPPRKYPKNIRDLIKDAHIKHKSAKVKDMISSIEIQNIKQMKQYIEENTYIKNQTKMQREVGSIIDRSAAMEEKLGKRQSIFSFGNESKRHSRFEDDPLDIYIPNNITLQPRPKDSQLFSNRQSVQATSPSQLSASQNNKGPMFPKLDLRSSVLSNALNDSKLDMTSRDETMFFIDQGDLKQSIENLRASQILLRGSKNGSLVKKEKEQLLYQEKAVFKDSLFIVQPGSGASYYKKLNPKQHSPAREDSLILEKSQSTFDHYVDNHDESNLFALQRAHLYGEHSPESQLKKKKILEKVNKWKHPLPAPDWSITAPSKKQGTQKLPKIDATYIL